MKTETYFRTQSEAVRDARIAIWGDVTLAKREHVGPRTHPDLAHFDERGVPMIVVSANVNGNLVLIRFDGYGRHERPYVVAKGVK